MTTTLAPIGARVAILGGEDNEPVLSGVVTGHGHRHDRQTVALRVLVQLDHGFYNPERSVFIAELSVHPDNIREAS